MIWNSISSHIRKFPDSVISDADISISYKQFLNEICSLSELFKKNNLAHTKCVILCEKNINTALYLLVCWSVNAIPIPVSINYGASYCRNIIKNIKPELIIADNLVLTIIQETSLPVYYTIEKKIINNEVHSTIDEELNDVALIMCTSGTTGLPKGAMITKIGLYQNVLDISDYFKVTSADKIMIVRPLFHCAVLTGEFLISLYKGLDIHFLDGEYNPLSLLPVIYKNKISVLCGTPTLFHHFTMYIKRLKQEVELKNIVISGECLTKEIADKIRSALPNTNIYNVYGLTEASPRVCYLEPRLFDSYPESVGIPLKSVEVKIVDKKDSEVLPNVDGQLIISGPSIMKGYYDNKSLTAQVYKKGWLYSGDIACKDENGYIYIKSRVDDMIIKAGMNIYPKEIENALKCSNICKEVLAYGIKTATETKIGIDFVLSEEYKDTSVNNLMKLCAELLPSYQLPDKISIREKLQRNASGKIIRPR